MNYSKGEWKVDLESGEITVNDSMVLGTIYGANDYPCSEEDLTEECKANAHLIAVAPLMYEAIKEFLACIENRLDIRVDSKTGKAICKLRESVTKAEGVK